MNSLDLATLLAVIFRGAAEGLETYLRVEAAEAVEAEDDDDGACKHPVDSRVPEPVSGKPHEFLCTACGVLVNPDEKVSHASS